MSLGAMIGVLTSPIGRLLGAVAILLAAYTFGNHRGAQRERAVCETAKAQSIAAAREIDRRAAVEAETRAAQDRQESAARMADMERRVQAYEHVTKSCKIDDAGRRMLDEVGGHSAGPHPGRMREPAVRGAVPIPPARPRDRAQ